MKVALITPPKVGNQVRGTGVYVSRLTSELIKIPGLEIEQLDFNFWKWDYSKFDLVHFLYFDPFFLTLPPIRNRKTVLTLMDLTPIKFPKLFPRGVKGEVKWQIQKTLVSGVDHLMTLSNSSKNDIKDELKVNSEKITVSYLAGDEFKRVTDQKKLHSISEKYALPKKFLLYLGDINPNKNIDKLLEAIALIPQKERPKFMLCGKSFLNKNLSEAQMITQKISKLNLNSDVILPGFVPDEDLEGLLSLATAYIQPSIYEGFGLPVVQAMSCACPVICANISSLPEVGGEAAIYADVYNPSDIAEKIRSLLNMSDLQKKQLGEKSLEQSKKFSWEKTAAVTHEVYKKLIQTS